MDEFIKKHSGKEDVFNVAYKILDIVFTFRHYVNGAVDAFNIVSEAIKNNTDYSITLEDIKAILENINSITPEFKQYIVNDGKITELLPVIAYDRDDKYTIAFDKKPEFRFWCSEFQNNNLRHSRVSLYPHYLAYCELTRNNITVYEFEKKVETYFVSNSDELKVLLKEFNSNTFNGWLGEPLTCRMF